jgi:hypothetical protein
MSRDVLGIAFVATVIISTPYVRAQTSDESASSVAPAPAAVSGAATNPVVAIPRDPFWPLGYVPRPKVVPSGSDSVQSAPTPAVEPEIEIRWPEIRLRGLVKNAKGGFLAIIDPFGLVEPGQILELEQGGLLYRWKVSTITGRGASCSRLDTRRAK